MDEKAPLRGVAEAGPAWTPYSKCLADSECEEMLTRAERNAKARADANATAAAAQVAALDAKWHASESDLGNTGGRSAVASARLVARKAIGDLAATGKVDAKALERALSTGSLHDSLLPFLSSQAMADPKIAAAIKAAVNSEVHAAAKGGELPKMKAEAAERRKAAPLHRKHPHKGKGEGKAEGK